MSPLILVYPKRIKKQDKFKHKVLDKFYILYKLSINEKVSLNT